jgi:hypothetical protein
MTRITIDIPDDQARYTLDAFGEGFVDYQASVHRNRYEDDKTPRGQVNAQAWDRGANAAMRGMQAALRRRGGR